VGEWECQWVRRVGEWESVSLGGMSDEVRSSGSARTCVWWWNLTREKRSKLLNVAPRSVLDRRQWESGWVDLCPIVCSPLAHRVGHCVAKVVGTRKTLGSGTGGVVTGVGGVGGWWCSSGVCEGWLR
jgi:hypothetical protein